MRREDEALVEALKKAVSERDDARAHMRRFKKERDEAIRGHNAAMRAYRELRRDVLAVVPERVRGDDGPDVITAVRRLASAEREARAQLVHACRCGDDVAAYVHALANAIRDAIDNANASDISRPRTLRPGQHGWGECTCSNAIAAPFSAPLGYRMACAHCGCVWTYEGDRVWRSDPA
jgi:hypothetical protein